MKFSKVKILYTIYIIGAVIFFLYVLFPAETLKQYIAYRLTQGNPSVKVTIDHLRAALPPGVKLYDITVSHRNAAIVDLDSLKITPSIFSILGSNKRIAFFGDAYSGQIKGTAEVDEETQPQKIEVDAELSEVQIQRISTLRSFIEHKLSGQLNGAVIFKNMGRDQTATGNFSITDGRIDFAQPVLNQKFLAFKDIDADLVLKNQELFIKRCSLKGSQMDATISGTISIDNRTGSNRLNVNGTMKPHHVLLASLGKNMPVNLIPRGKAGDKGFSFKIKGSLEAPVFSIK